MYILSIDQGTTGTTVALIRTSDLSFVSKINTEFPQIYPSPGLVEHNLEAIWETVRNCTSRLLKKSKIKGSEICAIGITNQRETICPFSNSGTPLHNAIVWQDRRTGPICENLKSKGHEKLIKLKTGLVLDPYFSASKIKWLLDNIDSVRTSAAAGNLKFGTIDTFLLYKLTSGTSFKTEPSNASRTMLMDLKTCSWDHDLLKLFGIKEDFLPEISDSFSNFGETKNLDFLPNGIPITGILGDQQAALFGQAGSNEGDMKCTYGTGAFLLLNTGTNIEYSDNGLLTTVLFKNKNKTIYGLEGSTFVCGAAVQWLRDNMKFISDAKEIQELAKNARRDDMEHVFFLPFFTGIGAPHWKSNAKATITGLSRGTGREHISMSALEGMAFSINDLITAFKTGSSQKIIKLKVDGGACRNDLLMEIQATVSGIELIRPKVIETTAYGAALAASIGKGKANIEDIATLWKKDKSFNPLKHDRIYFQNKYIKWKQLLKNIYDV